MSNSDSIYDQILSLIDESTNEPDAADGTLDNLILEVDNIKPDDKKIDVVKEPVKEVIECNLILDDTLEDFAKPLVIKNPEPFTQPITNTITLNGMLTNTKFHEEQLIAKLAKVNQHIVAVDCNYGTHKNDLYTPKRAVAKKVKPKKKRKFQGSGKCFNSQITFYIRILNNNIAEQYGFKVFRTGKLQLPGAKISSIKNIIASIKHIVDILNSALHPDEADINKMISLEYVTPSMKNYKFTIQMDPNCILSLAQLIKIILEKKKDYNKDTCKYPQIIDAKYSGEDTKLYINFMKPKSDKPIRVNIFNRGRVNILGGTDDKTTKHIFRFLQNIFVEYKDDLIINPNALDDDYDIVDAALPVPQNKV